MRRRPSTWCVSPRKRAESSGAPTRRVSVSFWTAATASASRRFAGCSIPGGPTKTKAWQSRWSTSGSTRTESARVARGLIVSCSSGRPRMRFVPRRCSRPAYSPSGAATTRPPWLCISAASASASPAGWASRPRSRSRSRAWPRWRCAGTSSALGPCASRVLRSSTVRATSADAPALHVLGVAAQMRGRFPEARGWMSQRLELAREIGDLRSVAAEAGNLSVVEQQLGDLSRARDLAAAGRRAALRAQPGRCRAGTRPRRVRASVVGRAGFRRRPSGQLRPQIDIAETVRLTRS